MTDQPPGSPRRVAVLLAGGTGARMGLEIPKQLIKIAGRPILEHALATLDDHPLVDEILVLMTPGHLDPVRAIVRTGGYRKVTQILEGAGTRNDTTLAALQALGEEECHVLLHDAVRPLLSARIVSDCFAALERFAAVDVAIPTADTIIEVDEHDVIRDIPPRASLRRGQTPQAFHASVIRRAYALAAQDPDFTATDDCTVVLRYLPDVPIHVVRGEDRNMKVTEPIDVHLADRLFQLGSGDAVATRSEEELRELLTDRVVVVLGGSYGIGADIADLARALGADVSTFSRSGTGTHVERRADLEAAAREVLQRTGRVDHVVNTAGLLTRGSLAEASEETIYAATEVNYLAPVFIAQAFSRALAQSHGSLLLFTSSSYTRGRAGYSLYSSAKAATVNLTQALADEWAPDGVRVNCINPERTATPMRSRAFGQEAPDSLLEPEVVARVALDVLVSHQTGQIVDVRRGTPA